MFPKFACKSTTDNLQKKLDNSRLILPTADISIRDGGVVINIGSQI